MKNKLLIIIFTFTFSILSSGYPTFRGKNVTLSQSEMEKNNAQIENLLSKENLFKVADNEIVRNAGPSSQNEVRVMRIMLEEQFRYTYFNIEKIEYNSNESATVAYNMNIKNLTQKDYDNIFDNIELKFRQKYRFNIYEISKKSTSEQQKQLYLNEVFSLTSDIARTEIAKIRTYKKTTGSVMLHKYKSGWDISNWGMGMSFSEIYNLK